MSGRGRSMLTIAMVLGGIVLVLQLFPNLRQSSTWQRLASPGALSRAHAALENDCAACHEPVAGAVASKCILCHASDASLLQRQPTAFHSSVSSCRECHREHGGDESGTSAMDHSALARIGARALQSHGDDQELALYRQLSMWTDTASDVGHSRTSPAEAALDCNSCHSNGDPHVGLMGRDCVECHGTTSWAIPDYRHPSSQSRDCAQCHQAPPSHYMMHFKMISARVAKKPHARVEQCYSCHRTTSWNDIPGTGPYKHH